MTSYPAIDLRSMRHSIARARKIVSTFGRHPIATADTSRLLRYHQVLTVLADLPRKYAALLSPIALDRARFLSLARHVPRAGRQLVLLHEAGHLYQRTAGLGITYDNDDWRTSTELGADAFAAVGLLPTIGVDLALEAYVWIRDVEDELTDQLMHFASGMWDEERAFVAARNRLLIREKIGV